jgi:hypothetical protein
LSDEVTWIFIGVLIGIPLGTVAGWVLAQLVQPRPSAVVVQKTDEGGYIILEK